MDDERAERFARALGHHRAGRHAAAAEDCRALLAADAADAAALYLFGLVRFAMGAVEDAILLMRRLVALRPGNALGQAALARLLVFAGRHGEAVPSYRAAVALAPDDAALAAGLANAERAAGDPAAAIETCRQALLRAPGTAPLHLALAWALLAAGQNEAAITALEPLVEAEDLAADSEALPAAGRAEACFLRGVACKALGDFSPAIAAFRATIAALPGYAAAHLELGNSLAALGRSDEARQALERAVAIAPGLAEAVASLGSVLLLAGDAGAAEAAFRRALAIDPGMVAAHRNLAAMAAARGQADEARAHRDAAYRRQCVFVETAGRPRLNVLLLTAAGAGNVPTQFLFPRERCTVVSWVIEYAGADGEKSLPPYDLVFNGLGDADAAAPAEAAMARFLATCRRPALNAPELVARTRRDLLPGLLGFLPGIAVPAVRRVAGKVHAGEVMRTGLGLPLLVRRAGSHGGQGVRLVASPAALAAALAAEAGGGDTVHYLARFWPFRSADGFHRKYRVIFVDRRPLPYHLAIGASWLVHYATAGMEADAARQAEEMRFLDDPERAIGARAMDGVRAIGECLDLDFAGVDFSLLPDGRALVFEANATMLVHPEDEAGTLAYRNPAVRRIVEEFEGMIARRMGSGVPLFEPPGAGSEASKMAPAGA